MSTSMQQIVSEARGLLQDSVVPYRYSDADLVQYGNDALDLIRDARPWLFYELRTHTCVAGPRQALSADGSAGIVDVLEVQNGASITKVDRDALDSALPSWKTKTKAAAARNWMDVNASKYDFWLYPPALAGQNLVVQHIAVNRYALGTNLDSKLDGFTSLVCDYMVGIAEARESEDAAAQREQMFISMFVAKLKGAKK